MQNQSKDFADPSAEKLLTLHEAAAVLGLHYWQLQRAVKRGDIPNYSKRCSQATALRSGVGA
jgi:hypothetical protein